MAMVTLKDEFKGKVTEEEIKKFFGEFVQKGAISKWGVPDRVLFVDTLAKTSVGKLNKELMDVYRTHKVNPMGGCLPMILQILSSRKDASLAELAGIAMRCGRENIYLAREILEQRDKMSDANRTH